MQGLGNDFIVLEGPAKPGADDVVRLCDRRFGIGADGVLVVTRGTPIVMDYWNADGSAAEMCGNGLRCVARYAYDKGWVDEAGSRWTHQSGSDRCGWARTWSMPRSGPLSSKVRRPSTARSTDWWTPGILTVRVVEDPGAIDLGRIGPSWPEAGFDTGCNVEVISVIGDRVKMRVWERGVGETLACGTGMVAAAAVALDGVDGTINVEVLGGTGRCRSQIRTPG